MANNNPPLNSSQVAYMSSRNFSPANGGVPSISRGFLLIPIVKFYDSKDEIGIKIDLEDKIQIKWQQ